LLQIYENDGLFCPSPTNEKDPSRGEDLRNDLTFGFSKPKEVETAKLLASACITLWSSQILVE